MPEWVRSVLKVVGIFFSLLATLGIAAYITILVLVPQENVVVPEVVGKNFEEAVLTLSQNKLSVRVVGKKFSTEIPEDVVISQTPAPNTKVREERNIKLVVSGGAKVVKAPSVTGTKVREAKLSFSEVGIKVAHVSRVHSELPEDEVIAQDPPAGENTTQEEGVSLLVSSGPLRPQLMMPDLRGIELSKVRDLLEQASVKIAMIKEQASSQQEGTVISQSPPPGSAVDENTRVEIVISGEKEKQVSKLPSAQWVLTWVQIPMGLDKKRVSVVIADERGTRTLDYGIHQPGKKVWVSCEVIGKGEVKVYVGGKLIKLEKVNG